MNDAYSVFLAGIAPDQQREVVIQNLSRLFKVSPAHITSLMGQLPYRVKQSISSDMAKKYRQALEKAGGIATIHCQESYADLSFDLPPTTSQVTPAPLIASGPISAPPSPPQDALGEFLLSHQLEHLAPLLRQHMVSYELLPEMTEDDLLQMGITAVGDRKRLRGAIQALTDQKEHTRSTLHQQQVQADGAQSKQAINIGIAILAALGTFLFASLFDSGLFGIVMMFALIFGLIWIYFLPSIIAFENQVEHRWIILVANFFFGATLFGWILLLVFAKRLVSSKAAATIGIIGAISGMT